MMFRFRMCKIQITQFAILKEKVTGGNLGFKMETSIKHSIPNKKIATEIILNFTDNKKNSCMVLGVQCDFDIHPEDWEGNIKDNTLTISKETMDGILSQTVGAARGILHCKTEGTTYNGFVLPPLDVKNVIKEDIKLTLD